MTAAEAQEMLRNRMEEIIAVINGGDPDRISALVSDLIRPDSRETITYNSLRTSVRAPASWSTRPARSSRTVTRGAAL